MNDFNERFLRMFVKAQSNLIAAERSRSAATGRRAAGMLEYVLLGAMAALIVGGVLSGGISKIIESLVNRIQEFVR